MEQGSPAAELSPSDLDDLRSAVRVLENPSLVMRLANLVGKPIEMAMNRMPGPLNKGIEDATHKALDVALRTALRSLGDERRFFDSGKWHTAVAAGAGAFGGAFGIAALAAELPLSTVIMLRAIASIARDQGENLNDPEAKLACLQVFALGSRSDEDDAAESAYFTARTAMSRTMSEAAAYLARFGAADEAAPILMRFTSRIAARFGITVSEKTAAQAAPILGALGGATLNLIFITHFQDMAQGHFIVRRLERKYGADLVRREYERLRGGGTRAQQPAASASPPSQP